MSKKFFGLGRGLESLIPAKGNKITPQVQDNVYYVEIHKIKPNANQPRRDFEPEGLKDLASSIKKYGILQPLLVTKQEIESGRGMDVNYEIIAGERRWRAAKLAGLPHVPVIVKDNFDEGKLKLEAALVENIQREDLNVLEEAEAYKRLADEFGLKQKEIAERVSKSREVVANAMRLMELPADIKLALRSGKISRTHARALLAFEGADKQREMFKKILTGNFATKELEQEAKVHKAIKKEGGHVHPRFVELQDNLSGKLGTAVFVKSGASGGNIVIKFGDLEELNKIAKTILD
ncbi:MAG: ParB/RepB/Spo0J family partition protein [bacterium]|nr:ParB/RepB/Spo0J family partition protein [bacterium]